MPLIQAAIFFLLIWIVVSVPLAMLVGAMIKFGDSGKLSLERADRKLGTPREQDDATLHLPENAWLTSDA